MNTTTDNGEDYTNVILGDLDPTKSISYLEDNHE